MSRFFSVWTQAERAIIGTEKRKKGVHVMKRALVFGGGGSKGAYELGVWKALDELGLSFDIVTGTSIGAMIGAMYVQKQYDCCLSCGSSFPWRIS